jgi:hypothetical protein
LTLEVDMILLHIFFHAMMTIIQVVSFCLVAFVAHYMANSES